MADTKTYTYRGPATELWPSAEAKEPIAPGGTIKLTDAQLRILVRNHHSFEAEGKDARETLDQATEALAVERDRRAQAEQAKKSQ